MKPYKVGYKKPPVHSRFGPGNRANPGGRPKRRVPTEAEVLKQVMNFPVQFRHAGRLKRAPRIELAIRRLGAAAIKGDIAAAAMLLEMRAHFQKRGDINHQKLLIIREMVYPDDT